MKTKIKSMVKFLSLSIILSSFVLGIYANTKFTNILAINNSPSKTKLSIKSNKDKNIKLANLDDDKLFRKYQDIEDWMLKISIKKTQHEDQKQLEEWMFEDGFWKIVRPIWDEEPVQENKKIESWMMNFEIQSFGCVDIYSDFKEKEWMKKHHFLIL